MNRRKILKALGLAPISLPFLSKAAEADTSDLLQRMRNGRSNHVIHYGEFVQTGEEYTTVAHRLSEGQSGQVLSMVDGKPTWTD